MKPIRGGLLSVVGAVLALLATAGTSWGAFPGANGLIAGAGGGGGDYWEIWTISPNGSDPARLTDNAIDDYQPSWSADGRRLVFIRGREYFGQNQNVWTMRADGSHQRQVTHWSAHESSPSFSPGGGRIVMTRGWFSQGNIVIVRTDGTDPVRLTSGRDARDPVFSPGGKRIVFAGSPSEKASSGIWVMRRDGTHKRLLASEARDPEDELDYVHPDFDPDGSHIVFERMVCVSHGCDSNDVLMRSNGRRKRSIGGGEEPVFSPNGRRLAARLVDCDILTETCTSRLISFARDGTWQTVTSSEGSISSPSSQPSWQPIPRL